MSQDREKAESAGRARPGAVSVGDVVSVEDGDYMYGTGTLVLQVTAVGAAQHFDGDVWLHLRGHRRRHTGTEPGERYALVRARRVRLLPPARQDRP